MTQPAARLHPTDRRHNRTRRPLAGAVTAILVATMVLPLAGCSNLVGGTVLKVLGVALDRYYGSRMDQQEAAGDHLRVLADKSEGSRGRIAVIRLAVQATNPGDANAQENLRRDIAEGTCDVAIPGLGKDYARQGRQSPYGVPWTESAIAIPVAGTFTGSLTCRLFTFLSNTVTEISTSFTLEALPFWQEGQLEYTAKVGQTVQGTLRVSSTGVPQPSPGVYWSLSGGSSGSTPPPGFSLDSPNCNYDAMGASGGAIANIAGSVNSCDLEVTWRPMDVATINQQLSVPYVWYRCRVVPTPSCSGADLIRGTGTLVFHLTGTGTGSPSPTPTQPPGEPGFAATPNPVDFGPRPAFSSTPPALPVTVTNPGSADLQVIGVTVDPTGEFAITDDQCTAKTVTPAGNCQLLVTFNPTGAGPKTAHLVFTTNAGGQAVPLTGTGTQADFFPDVTNLDFLASPVVPSAGQTVTVTNAGTANLTYGPLGVQLTGDHPDQYQITGDSCSSATVAPGDTCTVTVRFAPNDEGTMGAILQFTDNAPPFLHEISLNGVSLAG